MLRDGLEVDKLLNLSIEHADIFVVEDVKHELAPSLLI